MNAAARRVALLLVVVGTAIAPARAAGEPEIDGMYVAQGVNPDGTEYRAVVQIARHGESFLVSWMFPRASAEALLLEATSFGIGIVSGGTLAVSYYTPQTTGLVVYRIEEGGHRLAGQWTLAGDDGAMHAETLTKLKEEAVAPAPQAPQDHRQAPRPKKSPPNARDL